MKKYCCPFYYFNCGKQNVTFNLKFRILEKKNVTGGVSFIPKLIIMCERVIENLVNKKVVTTQLNCGVTVTLATAVEDSREWILFNQTLPANKRLSITHVC